LHAAAGRRTALPRGKSRQTLTDGLFRGKQEMALFRIAFRNILRNGRRSLMTASAIAIGAIALILFGEYRGMAEEGLLTGVVQDIGHLSVFRKGYLAFGSGRPEAYAISDYRALIGLIENDPELKPMLNVVTPAISLGGIASNAAADRAKIFFGSGFVPSDRDKMRHWDEYGLYTTVHYAPYPLSDSDIDHGVVGKGLAHILGLCKPRKSGDCPLIPGGAARLDLLSGASGAPNVVAFTVTKAQSQGAREMDDAYVGMHIELAQRLLYGSGARKVDTLRVQLKRSEDLTQARTRLEALLAAHRLDLEVHDFKELSPSFNQIMSALGALFAFVSAILFIIVLFTIANTMGMNVMERINEIGTARAMGVPRGGIRRQYLLEGAVLGVLGATAGLMLASLLTFAINHAGITYHMPISASAIPLYLMDQHIGGLLGGVWLALIAVAVVASFVPANRAARMKIVDALRHV
jgi:putative ABC transport system permease protein